MLLQFTLLSAILGADQLRVRHEHIPLTLVRAITGARHGVAALHVHIVLLDVDLTRTVSLAHFARRFNCGWLALCALQVHELTLIIRSAGYLVDD